MAPEEQEEIGQRGHHQVSGHKKRGAVEGGVLRARWLPHSARTRIVLQVRKAAPRILNKPNAVFLVTQGSHFGCIPYEYENFS